MHICLVIALFLGSLVNILGLRVLFGYLVVAPVFVLFWISIHYTGDSGAGVVVELQY